MTARPLRAAGCLAGVALVLASCDSDGSLEGPAPTASTTVTTAAPPSSASTAVASTRPSGAPDADATADVVVTRCELEGSSPSVQVRVTNRTRVTQDYDVTVQLNRADGGPAGTAAGRVEDVRPAQSVELNLLANADGEFTRCTHDVVRRPSG